MKTTYRIINKSKDGLKIKINGKIVDVSWDAFKKNMIMEDDKIHCRFTEKFLKDAERVEKAVMDGAQAMFLAGAANKLGAGQIFQMQLADAVMRITNEGYSIDEAMDLITKKVNELRSMPLFPKETPQEYRARKKREAAENDPHRTYSPTATQSLGDLPGMEKLKEQMFGSKI